jgi:uncharacterized cofD-like protein
MNQLRQLRWFYPGLRVKRWIALIIVGVLLFGAGFTFIIGKNIPLDVYNVVKATLKKPGAFGITLAFFGIVFIIYGIRRLTIRFIKLFLPDGDKHVVDMLYEEMYLRRGIRIVVIGGGTGLHTLLRGLKQHTSNITAIVTVSDDGGSSGRLRDELNILPPGDIRQCIAALARSETSVAELFSTRFQCEGPLNGHSVGNLLLAAMTELKGDFYQAVKELSKVLDIQGQVIPSTLSNVTLCAELEDGIIVRGETNITNSTGRVRRVFLSPPNCQALPEALRAIQEADIVVIGPGSLFTSIMPNLVVKDLAAALRNTKAVRVYVCNIMSQPGETDDFSASDHVEKIIGLLGKKTLDYVVVNKRFPVKQLERYRKKDQFPVRYNVEELKKLGVRQVMIEDLIMEDELVRHDPEKLGAVIMNIARQAVPMANLRRWPAELEKLRENIMGAK